VAIATTITEISSADPTGVRSPSAMSSPPMNSAVPAIAA
jgi:hypothetical protein